MTLEALLQMPNTLPTAPRVVEELISSFMYPNISVDEIARTLSADPVLSAKLLRLANSAYYHVSRSIGTVDDAVRMLGFVSVRTLVISAGLVSGFKTVPGLDLKRFWRYSMHTAVSAKWIARQANDNPELAFTIGMMHGLGQLVMHIGLPEPMLALDAEVGLYAPQRMAAERAAFGYDYSAVGAVLAERWKFPEIFASTIRDFGDPSTHGGALRMPAIVHLAVWRAQMEEAGLAPAELAATIAAAVAAGDAGALAGEIDIASMPPLAELSAGLDELVR